MHPPGRAIESIFLGNWGDVDGGSGQVLGSLLRATTKKSRQLFGEEKSAPQRKSGLRLHSLSTVQMMLKAPRMKVIPATVMTNRHTRRQLSGYLHRQRPPE